MSEHTQHHQQEETQRIEGANVRHGEHAGVYPALKNRSWKAIHWSDECPVCGCGAEVFTDCLVENQAFDGDTARCNECHWAGWVSVDAEDLAQINWNGEGENAPKQPAPVNKSVPKYSVREVWEYVKNFDGTDADAIWDMNDDEKGIKEYWRKRREDGDIFHC